MREEMQRDGDGLKIGWGTAHYFVHNILISIGLAWFFVGKTDFARISQIIWPILLIITGIALRIVQRRKLRFRLLGTPADMERFKAAAREVIAADRYDESFENETISIWRWHVLRDERWLIQVVFQDDDAFSLAHDLVTLRFDGREVVYNVINNPQLLARQVLACLFSRCHHGRELIEMLRERLNTARTLRKCLND